MALAPFSCPKCRGDLTELISDTNDEWYNHCPRCGVTYNSTRPVVGRPVGDTARVRLTAEQWDVVHNEWQYRFDWTDVDAIRRAADGYLSGDLTGRVDSETGNRLRRIAINLGAVLPPRLPNP